MAGSRAGWFARRSYVLVLYAGLLGLTGWRLGDTPVGLHSRAGSGLPDRRVQLPPGASLERTDAVVRKASAQLEATPGVDLVAGLRRHGRRQLHQRIQCRRDVHSSDDWKERGKELSAQAMAGQIMGALSAIEEANIFVLAPPPVQGMGNGAASR
jgi:multidrug efflux pump subunit AcrB